MFPADADVDVRADRSCEGDAELHQFPYAILVDSLMVWSMCVGDGMAEGVVDGGVEACACVDGLIMWSSVGSMVLWKHMWAN